MSFSPVSNLSVIGRGESSTIKDDYKQPFALLNALKHNSERIVKTGDVNELMDKDIGRLVYRIRGAVSANNYIAIEDLDLNGPCFYIQCSQIANSITTMHFEITTSRQNTIRITLSTLYQNEAPKFLGRSLRLPLPNINGWAVLKIDLNAILHNFCRIPGADSELLLHKLKKVQICSNLLLREILSADGAYIMAKEMKMPPKELSVKPSYNSHSMVDVVVYSLNPKDLDSIVEIANNRVNNIPKSPISRETRKPVAPIIADHEFELSSMNIQELSPSANVAPYTDDMEGGEPSKLKDPDQSYSVRKMSNFGQHDIGFFASQEHIIGYHGGPAVLIYSNRMLLFGFGSNLVMTDLLSQDILPQHGIWKGFVTDTSNNHRQSTLKGHSQTISHIEVSTGDRFMATVDSGKDSSLIIMWDLEEGNRIASMKPYQGNVSGIAFSSDNKYLVTVGFDTNARCTVLLWDITLLTLNNGIVIGSKSQCVIARQVSDVDIAKVRFLPVDGMNLVSCGRENVRLWRVRKTHFPSRPIILKEYCRGYNYTDIAISADKSNAEEVHFYVSSNKGVLLRIDYKSEQVLCAFQLHTMAINCVRIFNGYCVTGGSDNKLRIWPLDFGDFLLEARHEGRICNIHITLDGKKQVIGTDSGTLGVLDVTEHSYETIVRSHVAAISGLCCTNAEEVASISEDKTMRVWNLNTGLQSVEFLCESDTPKCICYHPTKKLLFCGFESGFIRVFDASEASTLFEINIRKGYSIREMQFVNLDSVVLLVVLDQIGTITVLDERTNFTQLSSVDLDIGASANSNKLISGGLSPFIAVLSPNSTSILSIPELQVISLDNSDRENGEDESLHRLIDLQFLSVDGHQFILTLATKHLTLYKLEKYGTNNFICKRRMMKSWDFGALISGFINPSQQLMFLHFKQRPKTVEVSPLKGTRSFSHSKASKLEDNFANVICQKFEVLIPDSLGRIKLSQPFGLNSLMNFSRSCLSAELQKIVTVDSNGGLLIWKIDMERVFNCEREFENESKKVIQIDCSPLPSKTVVFDHETSSVSPAEECSVNSKDSTTSAESDEREIMLMGRESKQEESFNPIVCEISLESLENLHPETMNDSKIDCDKVEEVAKDEVVEYNLNSSAVHEYQFYTLLPELEVTNAWAKVTQWRELLKDFSFVVSFGENKFVFDRIVRNERKHFVFAKLLPFMVLHSINNELRLLRTDQWTESILVLPNMQSFVSPLRLLTYCFTIDETHVIAVYVDSCGILLFVIWRVFGDHFEFLNQYEARTLKIGNISISKATFKLEPLDQNRLVLFHRIQGINWMVMLHFPSNFLSQHLAVSSIDISEVKNIVDLHSVTTSSKDFLVIRSFSKCLLLQLYAKNEGGIGTEVLWTEDLNERAQIIASSLIRKTNEFLLFRLLSTGNVSILCCFVNEMGEITFSGGQVALPTFSKQQGSSVTLDSKLIGGNAIKLCISSSGSIKLYNILLQKLSAKSLKLSANLELSKTSKNGSVSRIHRIGKDHGSIISLDTRGGISVLDFSKTNIKLFDIQYPIENFEDKGVCATFVLINKIESSMWYLFDNRLVIYHLPSGMKMLEMVRDGRENFIFSVDIVEASDTALIGFEDGKIEVWDSKTINKLFTFELIDCYSKVTEMFASSESNRSILRFYVRKDGKLSFIEVNMIEKINQILVLDSTEDIEHSKFSRIYCSDFDLLECTDNTNKVVLRKVNKVIEIFMLLEEENDVAQWKTKMNGKVDKLRKVLMPQMADLIGPEICFTKWLPISASFDTMKFCNTTCAFKENGDLYLLNLLSAMEDRDLSMQKHIRLISKCTGVFELKELGANVFLNMVESNEVRIICCDK